MKYVSSSDIKVYPSAYRGLDGENKKYDPESRLTTEFNVTRMNSAIASRKSFVITQNVDFDGNDDVPIEFSICGYYFKIKDLRNYITSGEALWANIMIKNIATSDEDGVQYELPTLSPLNSESESESERLLDLDNNFIGLKLSSSNLKEEDTAYESLQLLDKNRKIPLTSKLILMQDHVGIYDINGNLKPLSYIFDDIDSPVLAAKQLRTARTLWGQGFDGTANIDGDLSDVTKINTGSDIWQISSTGVGRFPGGINLEGSAIFRSGDIIPDDNDKNIGTTSSKYSNVYATNFNGDLKGNANTATNFESPKTITLSGDVTGSDNGGNKDNPWSITATIGNSKVTTAKIASNAVTGAKLGDVIGTGEDTANGIKVTLSQTSSKGDLSIGIDCSSVTKADTLTNSRNFSLTGDVSASAVSFNGSSNVQLSTTIGDGKVTTAKIADSSITTAKIADSNVTNAKLAAGVSDSTSASAFSSTSSKLVTERDVYYGTPQINGSNTYNRSTKIYAPTSYGSKGGVLVSTGTSTPTFKSLSIPVFKKAAITADTSYLLANLSSGILATATDIYITEDGVYVMLAGRVPIPSLSQTLYGYVLSDDTINLTKLLNNSVSSILSINLTSKINHKAYQSINIHPNNSGYDTVLIPAIQDSPDGFYAFGCEFKIEYLDSSTTISLPVITTARNTAGNPTFNSRNTNFKKAIIIKCNKLVYYSNANGSLNYMTTSTTPDITVEGISLSWLESIADNL